MPPWFPLFPHVSHLFLNVSHRSLVYPYLQPVLHFSSFFPCFFVPGLCPFSLLFPVPFHLISFFTFFYLLLFHLFFSPSFFSRSSGAWSVEADAARNVAIAGTCVVTFCLSGISLLTMLRLLLASLIQLPVGSLALFLFVKSFSLVRLTASFCSSGNLFV